VPGGQDDRVTTLHLLRHAKSSWDDAMVPDHDRPLAPRGARAARRIAAHLPSAGIDPDLVLCSSSRRTLQTLEALRPALGETAQVSIEPELYGADASEILERLRAVDTPIPQIMVIAHNPGLEDLAIELSGEGDAALLNQLRTKFPTGALATFDVHDSWPELGPGHAHLTHLVTPKDLS
jgi:phosphohistidine phosphatase